MMQKSRLTAYRSIGYLFHLYEIRRLQGQKFRSDSILFRVKVGLLYKNPEIIYIYI